METYRVGVDVAASDWISAAEYAIELVRSQHPLAAVELAYIKEFHV